MNTRHVYISVFLMVLAIAAIITFQAYWLYSNYKEERQNLRIQTNILFREAVYQCQAKKMNLDTSIKFRYTATDRVRVVSALQSRLRDTLHTEARFNSTIQVPGERKQIKIFKDSFVRLKGDSSRRREPFILTANGDKTVIEILETAEALQDSITIKEVEDQYRTMLARENIKLPFSVARSQSVTKDKHLPADLEVDNEVSVGFLNPVTFKVNVTQTMGYIIRKMSPIILVSVLLVTITVLSFVLLFRNLMQQRRLTLLKNDFISNVTHELKTPIATVSVAIEAMRNFNVLENPARTQEYLNISTNELQRLSSLVDKVLKLSMFEQKKIELKKDAFDLGQLVNEVLKSMRLQFEKQNADVEIELSGNNFVIEADKRHISSVIYNLLDNALKYSIHEPQIKVHVADRANFIELRVSDNGIGIPPEYRTKIFEQFFRVPNGDRHNIKGYGLGLSYVSHIVQSHQGVIDLESELNKGSVFIIKLPFGGASVIAYDKNRRIVKEKFPL